MPSAPCVVSESGVTAISRPCWLSDCSATGGEAGVAALGASGETSSTIAAARTLDTPTEAAMDPITRFDLDVLVRCFPLIGLSPPLDSKCRRKRSYPSRPATKHLPVRRQRYGSAQALTMRAARAA